MSVPEGDLERLLESGVEIPEDPVEIERLLAEQSGEPAADPAAEKPPEGEKPAEEPAAAEPEKPAADTDEPEGADKPKPADKPAEEPAAEVPGAVLRETRQSLHKAEELLKTRDEESTSKDELISKLEGRVAQLLNASNLGKDDLQTKADEITDEPVKLDDLTPEKIAEIREEAGDEAADLLEGLLKQNKAIDTRLQELEQSNTDLAQQREQLETQEQMNDIDAVPLLSVLHAQRGDEADTRWGRAVDYEKALRADPDWADKSRREIYAEVGGKMKTYLGDEAVKSLLGDEAAADPADPAGDGKPAHETAVDEAIRRADESAVPTSLSDLPAGQAMAQSEFERAQGMSITDIEASINKALDSGKDGAVDEVLNRFMTADPT